MKACLEPESYKDVLSSSQRSTQINACINALKLSDARAIYDRMQEHDALSESYKGGVRILGEAIVEGSPSPGTTAAKIFL